MQKFKINISSAMAIIFSILLCLISILLAPLNYSVAAADGSLTLICKTEGVTLVGLHWDIYRVGSREGNSFNLVGDFKDYPVVLNDFSAEAMNTAAKTLENFAVLDGLTPLQSGETNENGTLTFDSLEEGLYLVSGTILTIGDTTYVPSTLLFEIDNEGEAFDLNAYPKIILRTNSTEISTYTVKKIWQFSATQASQLPDEITIEVYCDRVLYDTVTLSDENSWTYSWMGDTDCEWRVKEVAIPENCTVVYDFGETQYAIVNTVDGNIPEPPTTTTTTTTTTHTDTRTDITTTTTITETTPKTESSSATVVTSGKVTSTTTVPGLPQTGQLWWPVPVLGVMGIVLIAFGIRMNSEKKRDSRDEIN